MVDFRYLELADEPPEPVPPVPARLDYWELCRIAPPPRLLRRYSLALLDRYRWVPLHETSHESVSWLPAKLPAPTVWGPDEGPRLYIAAEDPQDPTVMRAIALRTGRAVRALPVDGEALDRFLAERYPVAEPPEKARRKGWWP